MNQSQPVSGFQRVFKDVSDLCELQWQLLSVDSQQAKQQATRAVICLTAAGVIAFCGLSAAAIGVGFVLQESFDLYPGVGMLLSALIFLIIAGLATLIGIKLIGKANASLSETKQEFAENVRWIKSVIISPQTSARNQLRREDFPPEYSATGSGSRRF